MVATLRSDFLSVFQSQPALLGLEVELLPVGPMAVEDVAEVIEGPARVAGLELETGLVQAMLADTGSNDALPLLAFTLRDCTTGAPTAGSTWPSTASVGRCTTRSVEPQRTSSQP